MTDPLVQASLVSAGGGLVNSLLGGFFGSSANQAMDKQYNFQRQMADQQQAYWKEQFNLINEYNDPSAAVRRYLRAGISPSAAFGGSTVGQSSSSASMGQGGSPVPYPPTMQNDVQMFSTLAQALSSLGSAFKNTAEGRSISSMLAEQVRGIKMTNDQQEWRNALERTNLPKKQRLEIGKLHAEILQLQAEVNVANEEELLKIEQRFTEKAKRINELTKGEILQKENENWMKNFQSVLDVRRSEIASNNASSRFSNASADRESFFNTLRADPDARASLLKELKQQGDIAVSQKRISRADADKAYHLAELATFADDVKEFDWAFDKALKVAKGIYDGVSVIGSLFRTK